MISEQPVVSIIIVNTNDERVLIPCLESLQQHESELPKEVLIVDNHSSSDIRKLLTGAFTGIRVISLNENSGFCRANNAGIREAKGKYLLLLNPDTILREACISKCIEYFESRVDQKIGIVGCRLLNVDGILQKSFHFTSSSILKATQANPIYIKLFHNGIKRTNDRREDELHSRTSKAPWLCGAFLLMNREVILAENFFLDEDFFLYSDDCELGYRMRKKNYELIYFSQASIIHLGGGIMPALKRNEQLAISEWLCMMKVHGKFYFTVNQLLVMLNLLLDELLYRRAAFQKKIRLHHLREKVIRRRLWLLWKKYTLRILLRYKRAASSATGMLRFQP